MCRGSVGSWQGISLRIKKFTEFLQLPSPAVRNEIASLFPQCHYQFMLDKTAKKKLDGATRASVKKEMDRPRVAKSGRILDPASVTMHGTVEKIIPALGNDRSEKAQIAIDRTQDLYREIRINNTLQTEDGENVSLKAASRVDVKIGLKNQDGRYTKRQQR
jgi:hypothetical protein